MVTQQLTIRLDEKELPEIRMVSGDVGREIRIEVYAREDSDTPIDLETYSADITIIKPDNTFIMDNFDGNMYELPEQAGAVSGSGYYQIKIYTSGTRQIYTGQGPFLVDDMILSDDVIESSSIAFGDRFPEDFATKEWVDDEIEAHGIGTYVAGNPAGEETMPPLVRLQINDDIYPISHKIEEMEDADITTPAAGDVLTYDADDQKWKNEPLDIPDPTVTKTATGNPIELTDAASAPLVKCVTQITGYQSGTGTPSPDNIRPITAYTEGEIEVRGKNAFDGTVYKSGYAIDGNGAEISASNYSIYKFVGLDGNNILSFADTNQTTEVKIARVGVYDENGNALHVYSTTYTTSSGRIDLPFDASNSAYVVVSLRSASATDIQIEKGSTATTYEPYVGTAHTAQFSQSIYQGEADMVNGSATCEIQLIDLSTLSWITRYIGSVNKTLSATVPDYLVNDPSIIAEQYEYKGTVNAGSALNDPDNLSVGIRSYKAGAITVSNIIYIVLPINDSTTGNITLKLSTPTTEQIAVSNAPVKSLAGYSHIESTTGEMEVEYITETYDAIMQATQLDNMKVYSTAEQVVGKWVDGSDVYESVIITEFNNATPQYTVDFSNIGGVSTMPIFVSHSVLEAMEGTTPIKQIVMPAASNSGYSSIAVNHQSSAVTGKAYLTVRYIKL